VALLLGEAPGVGDVSLIGVSANEIEDPQSDATRLALELTRRLGGSRVPAGAADGAGAPAEPRPGQLRVVPASAWEPMAASDPPPGAATVVVLEPGMPWGREADELGARPGRG
jgi:hypothetical protein